MPLTSMFSRTENNLLIISRFVACVNGAIVYLKEMISIVHTDVWTAFLKITKVQLDKLVEKNQLNPSC